jgi:hypothetical protein
MGWERVVGDNPEGHRCPTPSYSEWFEEKNAEEGSQWRCDECNVLWTLVCTGDMNGFSSLYWEGEEDRYAKEVEDSYRAASDRINQTYGGHEAPIEILTETKSGWKRILS